MNNLNQAQTLTYAEFLLALSDSEYMEVLEGTQVGQNLFEGVVNFAKLHYPLVTITC